MTSKSEESDGPISGRPEGVLVLMQRFSADATCQLDNLRLLFNTHSHLHQPARAVNSLQTF